MLIPFFLSLFYAILGTVLFPSLRLIAFAPFLSLAFMRTSLISSLWLAFLSGLIIDLLSAELRFGTYALNYSLTTLILYNQKRHFFEDKPLSLSLFTLFFSLISTLLQLLLFKEVTFTWKLALTDLFVMPLCDALYALFWFTIPLKIIAYLKKGTWRRFLTKQTEEESE